MIIRNSRTCTDSPLDSSQQTHRRPLEFSTVLGYLLFERPTRFSNTERVQCTHAMYKQHLVQFPALQSK
jgi:hypothetical protein